jgi:hypothetical protein
LIINFLSVKIVIGCIGIKNKKPFEQFTQKAFFSKNTEGYSNFTHANPSSRFSP